ncbi:MAG: hypothetical protein ACE5E4_08850 [Candidatus Binatia bacterium]
MSTILEALKGERSDPVRPRPPRRETPGSKPGRRRFGYGPSLLVAAAGTLAVVSVVTLWPERETDSVGREPAASSSATANKPRRLSGMKGQAKATDRDAKIGSREKTPALIAKESERPRIVRGRNSVAAGADPLMPPVLGSSDNPARRVPVLPAPAKGQVGSERPRSTVDTAALSVDSSAAPSEARGPAIETEGSTVTSEADARAPVPHSAVKQPVPEILDEPPPGAPAVDLIFVQWVREASARMASIRASGGVMIVIREGDTVEGMRVASIGREWVDFSWKGTTFRVPIRRF